MKIIFYRNKSHRDLINEFISDLDKKDRAKVLACLESVEELGFECPRVGFRQIKGQLWEIKIHSVNGGYRFFYVILKKEFMVLIHAYKKQSQKAPKKEIEVAEKRMWEILNHEKDYIE